MKNKCEQQNETYMFHKRTCKIDNNDKYLNY